MDLIRNIKKREMNPLLSLSITFALGLSSTIGTIFFIKDSYIPYTIHLFFQLSLFVEIYLNLKGELIPNQFLEYISICGCIQASTSCLMIAAVLFSWFISLFIANFTSFFTYKLQLLICFGFSILGAYHSSIMRKEVIDVTIKNKQNHSPKLIRKEIKPRTNVSKHLKIYQITDPHIGTFMSIKKFQKLCEEIVKTDPDLVFLTGDYFTMKAHLVKKALRDCLLPLKKINHKVFACLGNHDHEVLSSVIEDLKELGITLLVDDRTTTNTRLGKVEIVGTDFRYRKRKEGMEQVCEKYPRQEDTIARFWLVHNPFDFKYIKDGDCDLCFSGHTHGGGGIGLKSLGFPKINMVSFFTAPLQTFGLVMPESGLWSQGSNLLYVHSGTGFYGNPLRIGIPNEDSLIRVHFD